MANINPFWSQELQEEARLRNARPEDLPMVPDESDRGASSEELQPAGHGLFDL